MDRTTETEQTFGQRVLMALGLVVVTGLLLALLYFTFDVILLIFAAVLLAVFLRSLAELLGRYVNIRESLRVIIISVLLIGILAGAIALLAPSVAEQAAHLREELPKSARAAGDYIAQYSWGRAILEQIPEPAEMLTRIRESGFLSRVGGIFSTTIGAVGNFFIVILLAIYLAAEPKFYTDGFTKLFPIERRPRVSEVLTAIGETLRWWLIGKAGSMIFIGILTWIGLSIIGVPLALTLGLIAGLLSFIPNFGPIISAVPAVLLAFVASPISAVYTIALFIGVQLIESNVVTPIIERETIELPPAITIIFQLALAVLVGGLGLVLATPLLAVILVLVQMVYIEDVLGDRDTEVKEMQRESAETERTTPSAEAADSPPS